jgi:hypothetical protein
VLSARCVRIISDRAGVISAVRRARACHPVAGGSGAISCVRQHA